MACRSGARSRHSKSVAVSWVRVTDMPQPKSTPTQAGITTSSVGTTEPTVEPIPQWASGINAT